MHWLLQRKGRIPVIYDTENNFDFTYAKDMGFEAEPDVEVRRLTLKLEKLLL